VTGPAAPGSTPNAEPADAAATPAVAAHVLVTSASRKAPLIRAVHAAARKIDGSIRVVAGDIDDKAPVRYVADAFWQMPPAIDENIESILDGCKRRAIGIVLPTRDGELKFWCRVRDRFAGEGVEVIVSPLDSVERCLDKLAFSRFGEAEGLPIIRAGLRPDEAGAAPYVVKERFGSGSRGVGLNLSRDEALRHAMTLERPIFQPFHRGTEISIDAWLDRGCRLRGIVLRRRDVVIGGESQVTTTFRDPDIEAQAAVVLRALKLRGPVVMQAVVGEGERLDIIECNARFGGASTAAIAAGLDMIYWSLLETRSPSTVMQFERIRGEIRQVRLPSDVIIHDPDL
jgi:carbamoyl-phosphate synthase large subunit